MTDRLKDALKNGTAPKPPKGFRALTPEEEILFKEQGSQLAILKSQREMWAAKRDLAEVKLAETDRLIAGLQPQLAAFNKRVGISSDKDVQLVGETVFVRIPKKSPNGNGKGKE